MATKDVGYHSVGLPSPLSVNAERNRDIQSVDGISSAVCKVDAQIEYENQHSVTSTTPLLTASNHKNNPIVQGKLDASTQRRCRCTSEPSANYPAVATCPRRGELTARSLPHIHAQTALNSPPQPHVQAQHNDNKKDIADQNGNINDKADMENGSITRRSSTRQSIRPLPNKMSVGKFRSVRKATYITCGVLVATAIATFITIVIALAILKNAYPFRPSVKMGTFIRTKIVSNNIHARTLGEYNDIIKNNNNELYINVKLSHPSDWPLGGRIEESRNVKLISAEGPFHGNKIIDLMDVTTTLEKVVFNNDHDFLCSETQQPIAKLKANVVTSVAKQFVFTNVTPSCHSLFEGMGKRLRLAILQEFTMNGGKLDINSLNHLLDVLSFAGTTLSRMEMNGVLVDDNIFKPWPSRKFMGVKSIVFDVSRRNTNSMSALLSHQFCSIFPNLQHLSFGNNYRSWDDVVAIYNCKHLKALTIKIKMSPLQSNFSLSFLSTKYPRLESADITLQFDKCAPGSDMKSSRNGNYIVGHDTLPDILLVNTRVTSNCNLIHVG